MAVEMTGIVKYARVMKGEKDGTSYEFFSFVVLDQDEGVRWPLQMDQRNPQYKELCQLVDRLVDQRVRVVIRSFSAGTRKDRETKKEVPQARFYAKSVKVLPSASLATEPVGMPATGARAAAAAANGR